MDCTVNRISYRHTNYFTKIVLDYLDEPQKLQPFFAHLPTTEGIKKAVAEKKNFPVNRKLLVQELRKQYSGAISNEAVNASIESLLSENTFTVTTAHQPNI